MSVEAMKQALEALDLDYASSSQEWDRRRIAAIAALRLAIEQAERQEPVAWQGVHDTTDLYWRKPVQGDVRPLYTAPPQRQPLPGNWSVFNSGAEVFSGLTFDEAWGCMTPERLARGWTAVCVVNKDNLPVAHGIGGGE